MSEKRQSRRSSSEGTFSEAGFEALHRETFPKLWSFARRICDDEDEAHDICQRAYVVTWRYWSGGTLREEPRRLLFHAAKLAAIDALRARQRRARLAKIAPMAVQSSPGAALELREALSALDHEERALLLLHASARLSYEELAALEGQTVPAVRSRLYRARRALRAALQVREE